MLGTYVSLALVLGASWVVGQAFMRGCGQRGSSPIAPAVGLALLCPVAWGATNLASSAWAGLVATVAVVALAARLIRAEPARGEVAGFWPVLAGAIFLGSLPFFAELRFGILGTGLNPDMSQHLFAADRLANGGEERLVAEGYPLGPHALVASISKLGPSLVHGFNGLTLATGVAAALAALGGLSRLAGGRRVGAALLVGMAYLLSSYLIQGAFKETMQALFLLAFAVYLGRLATEGREEPEAPAETAEGGHATTRARVRAGLRALPLAALAIGSLYVYSFPGLAWLAGALGIWSIAEIFRARSFRIARSAAQPTAIAIAAFALAAAPELPRLLDFATFETFDPDGPGLGNLFNPISPIEALGIWPSGDFRLDPGAGLVPAALFYLGGLVGALALAFGLWRALRERDARPVAAAVLAGAALYLYALVAGTPYQEAKALVLVAPVAALVAIRGLLLAIPPIHSLRNASARALALPGLTLAFVVGAAGSSLLALVNGPVGPAHWTPALLEFSEEVEGATTLAIVDDELASENGVDLVTWELRGREVCVLPPSEISPATVSDQAFEAVVVVGKLTDPLPVVGRLEPLGRAQSGGLEYELYRAKLAGNEPDCPFVADGDRAEPR